MVGNFRIVQEGDESFIVEKEFEFRKCEPTYFWLFKIREKTSLTKEWGIVDRKGKILDWFANHKCYRYKTFEEAKKVIEDIKKYPKVVFGTVSLEDLKEF